MMGSDPESWIREEFPDVVTDPAIIRRELLRFSLRMRGVNLEGAHVFMYVCDLLDAGHRTLIGSAPLPFFGAIFDSSCIQRPMLAGVTALARKLESALDEATSACERADIHQFLFYFEIIRIFTGIFQYSNYRSIDWHAMLLTPFLTSALWRHDDFVQAPVRAAGALAGSRALLADVGSSSTLPA